MPNQSYYTSCSLQKTIMLILKYGVSLCTLMYMIGALDKWYPEPIDPRMTCS